jgi:hypothetical protein
MIWYPFCSKKGCRLIFWIWLYRDFPMSLSKIQIRYVIMYSTVLPDWLQPYSNDERKNDGVLQRFTILVTDRFTRSFNWIDRADLSGGVGSYSLSVVG